jgi:hypothetical protein
MKEIRASAAVLQALDTFSKLFHRLCTAEVRGSNPLGSTFRKCCYLGEMRTKNQLINCQPSLCAKTNT